MPDPVVFPFTENVSHLWYTERLESTEDFVMQINPHLIWDYPIAPEEEQKESFKKWYIARLLQRGGPEDIRAVGLETIHHYLPILNLPSRIRDFWNWYFQTHPSGDTQRTF